MKHSSSGFQYLSLDDQLQMFASRGFDITQAVEYCLNLPELPEGFEAYVVCVLGDLQGIDPGGYSAMCRNTGVSLLRGGMISVRHLDNANIWPNVQTTSLKNNCGSVSIVPWQFSKYAGFSQEEALVSLGPNEFAATLPMVYNMIKLHKEHGDIGVICGDMATYHSSYVLDHHTHKFHDSIPMKAFGSQAPAIMSDGGLLVLTMPSSKQRLDYLGLASFCLPNQLTIWD